MREEALRRALDNEPIPDQAAAEERAWRVVQAAHAEQPFIRPRRTARRAFARVAIVIGLLAVLVSPAGANVRHWVGDAIDSGHQPSRPALTSLPSGGALLIDSPSGPWIVHGDGSKRLLGNYQQATWSPHGLFVAATTRHQLLAVDPAGNVRWSLARSGPVADPAWSPDGFRIAYLSGHTLRVVAGDGSGDRLLARGVRPITPAWKPGNAHVLTFVAGDGRLRTVETDSGHQLFASQTRTAPTALAWSSDGSRLLVSQRRGLSSQDSRGRLIWRYRAPAGSTLRAVAPSPTSHQIAVIVAAPGGAPQSRLLLLDPAGAGHNVFFGPGRFADVAWSPNGQWLLLSWPAADQWLFVRPGSDQRIVAVSHIASQFAPGGVGSPQFPSITGWCCSIR